MIFTTECVCFHPFRFLLILFGPSDAPKGPPRHPPKTKKIYTKIYIPRNESSTCSQLLKSSYYWGRVTKIDGLLGALVFALALPGGTPKAKMGFSLGTCVKN